ncbi:hypothetical protein T4B_12303 [Trichinella pseudospiralis]|uniref:Uncharacterized protein n=1 Tax=Trichinella pseudospiralis TaxID=6337 RepID=A0A0V1HEY1_TRIPS|nr:hypothetical protein T4B_12303 [Trichinella pseudospiralis]
MRPADRGRHEADRGRHEAELWNEDIRYMWFPKGPNSVGSNRLLVNYVRWSGTLVGQLRSLVKLRRNKRPILRYFLAMMTM